LLQILQNSRGNAQILPKAPGCRRKHGRPFPILFEKLREMLG
jgi:hypothetical protein